MNSELEIGSSDRDQIIKIRGVLFNWARRGEREIGRFLLKRVNEAQSHVREGHLLSMPLNSSQYMVGI